MRCSYTRKHRGRASHGWVFLSAASTPLGHSNLLRDFKLAVAALGLPQISQLAKNDKVAPRVTMELAGHTDIKTTIIVYAEVGQADQRAAINGVFG